MFYQIVITFAEDISSLASFFKRRYLRTPISRRRSSSFLDGFSIVILSVYLIYYQILIRCKSRQIIRNFQTFLQKSCTSELSLEGTHARKNSNKFGFLLAYSYLCCRIIKTIRIMNENNNNNKQQGLQIEMPQEVAQGAYSNFAVITHGSGDFVIDFARVLPGVPKEQPCSRIIMARENVRRLLLAPTEQLMRYEAE